MADRSVVFPPPGLPPSDVPGAADALWVAPLMPYPMPAPAARATAAVPRNRRLLCPADSTGSAGVSVPDLSAGVKRSVISNHYFVILAEIADSGSWTASSASVNFFLSEEVSDG